MAALIPGTEIAVSKKENIEPIVNALLDEGYAVLLSHEEQLTIINYLWCEDSYADRNDVVFMPRDIFELEYYHVEDDEFSAEPFEHDKEN